MRRSLAAVLAAVLAVLAAAALAAAQDGSSSSGGGGVDTSASMSASVEWGSGDDGGGGGGESVEDSEGSPESSSDGDTLPFAGGQGARPTGLGTAPAPPEAKPEANQGPNFGRGKLTIIRNFNQFVTKTRTHDRTKVEEAKLKLSVQNEEKNKQAYAFEDATRQRVEAAKLERAKEKYEAVAEAARKKVSEEKSKLSEAALKAKLAGDKREAEKHAKHHASLPTSLVRLTVADRYCLSVRHGRRHPGNPVVLWHCNPNSHSQQFKLRSDHTIRMAVDHRWCVEVPRGSARSGDRLQINRCGLGKRQLWKRLSDGSLRPLSAPKLAVTLGGKGVVRNGQHLFVERRRHAAPAQEWSIAKKGARPESPAPRLVALRDKFLRDTCFNLRRQHMAEGGVLNVMRCRGKSHAQLFQYNPSDSTLRLSRRPEMCAGVHKKLLKQDQPLVLTHCGGRPNTHQQFLFDRHGHLSVKGFHRWLVEVTGAPGRGFPKSSTGLALSTRQSARAAWQRWQLRDPSAM